MKSKIRIDLAQDNNPVIIISYEESDDFKDLAVKRFLDDLKNKSRVLTCELRFKDELNPNTAILRAIYDQKDLDNVKIRVEHRNLRMFIDKVENIIKQYQEESDKYFGDFFTWQYSDSWGIGTEGNLYPKLKDFSYKKLTDYIYELLDEYSKDYILKSDTETSLLTE